MSALSADPTSARQVLVEPVDVRLGVAGGHRVLGQDRLGQARVGTPGRDLRVQERLDRGHEVIRCRGNRGEHGGQGKG